MEDNRDLGKWIKQRFQDIEVEPDANLWHTIENTLEERRKKRAGYLWFWGTVGTLLGILILTYVVSDTLKSHPEPMTPPTMETPRTDMNEELEKDASRKQKRIGISPKTLAKPGKNVDAATKEHTIRPKGIPLDSPATQKSTSKADKKATITNDYEKLRQKGNIVPSPKSQNQPDAITPTLPKETSALPNSLTQDHRPARKKTGDTGYIGDSSSTLPPSSTTLSQSKDSLRTEKVDLEEFLTQEPPTTKKEQEEEVKTLKILDPATWLISAQIGPSYYGYLTGENPFEASLTSGKNQGKITLSYAILLHIPISDRLDLRLGYRSTTYRPTVKNAMGLLNANRNAVLFGDDAISRNAVPIPTTISTSITNGEVFDLYQKIRYHGIPLEFYYTFLPGKLNLDVIGGVNVLFLGKSSIALRTNGSEVTIGSAQYLKQVTLTPTLGVGVRYQLNDRVRLDLEPVIQFHLDAFDRDFKNRRPFALGLQTGVTLKL